SPISSHFPYTTLLRYVLGGVSGGIEKASKVLMPVLFLLVFLVMLRSLTLPGAMEGVRYYLTPDFSKINGQVVLAALGQAFFFLRSEEHTSELQSRENL